MILAIGVPDQDDGNSFNTGAVNVIYGSTGGGLQPTGFSTGNGRVY